MDKYVSEMTLKNWEKLRVSENETRLVSRANKTNSKKTIIPYEYISDMDNISKILEIASMIKKYDIAQSLFSLGLNLLKNKNISFEKNNVKELIKEYNYKTIDELYNVAIPLNEFDLLGTIYQICRTEGDKNINGAYYTPPSIIKKMLSECNFKTESTVIDPCCGSGAFLMCIESVSPKNLYGYDIDKIAVMIAKFNLIIKDKDDDFYPNIIAGDYNIKNRKKYDYVITNPPWGAFKASGCESFSTFIKNGLSSLNNKGKLIYLLPFSFLSVKKHEFLRKYILENYNVKKISVLSEKFNGVTTKSIILSVENSGFSDKYIYSDDNILEECSAFDALKIPFASLGFISKKDKEILKRIYSKNEYSLKESIWALGIVTGNNKEKIHGNKISGSQGIYSGKNVTPFKLIPCNQYIVYNKKDLQQSAPEEIYRAKEKLIYRFISKHPIFACDTSGSLVLNSANILIPQIKGMSIWAVMAFLNSELYKYIYSALFNDIKVLRGNLEILPFIKIDKKTDELLKELSKKASCDEIDAVTKINDIVYSLFSLSKEDIKYIKSVII